MDGRSGRHQGNDMELNTSLDGGRRRQRFADITGDAHRTNSTQLLRPTGARNYKNISTKTSQGDLLTTDAFNEQ